MCWQGGSQHDSDVENNEIKTPVTELRGLIKLFLINTVCIFKSRSGNAEDAENPGTISDMGLLHQIINKIFFCMKSDTRLGVFLLLTMFKEVFDLLSLSSNIMVTV